MIRKKTIFRLTVLFFIGALALIVFLLGAVSENAEEEHSVGSVLMAGESFEALIADTQDLQIQGLSGRSSLDENQGMLFIFDDPQIQSFWMKDMLFPIDIIWIDENYQIVGFVEEAQPESYPESFSSVVPAQYVFEVNAGTVGGKGIEVGDVVRFTR